MLKPSELATFFRLLDKTLVASSGCVSASTTRNSGLQRFSRRHILIPLLR
jgi:hypothetical protein